MTEGGPTHNQVTPPPSSRNPGPAAGPANPGPGQQPAPASKNVFDWLAGVRDTARPAESAPGGANPGPIRRPTSGPSAAPGGAPRPASSHSVAARQPRPAGEPQPVGSAQAGVAAQPGGPGQPRPSSWGLASGATTWNPNRRGRRARLRLARIDPWSVMKTFFLFAVAAAIMNWVSMYVVWSVLDATGMFESINKAARDILASPTETNTFDVKAYLSRELVLGLTAIVGAVNVVIFTTLATIAAFLYNLSAGMLGGLEVTLSED